VKWSGAIARLVAALSLAGAIAFASMLEGVISRKTQGLIYCLLFFAAFGVAGFAYRLIFDSRYRCPSCNAKFRYQRME